MTTEPTVRRGSPVCGEYFRPLTGGLCVTCGRDRGEHAAPAAKLDDDPVNHPRHYAAHPSGVECITITEHMGFNVGNAIKYLWRADEKGAPLQDLRKAAWYVAREIERRERMP